MDNFEFGLIGMGLVLLAAVIVHGLWIARKNAPRQADTLSITKKAQVQAQVQMGEPLSIEPALDPNHSAIQSTLHTTLHTAAPSAVKDPLYFSDSELNAAPAAHKLTNRRPPLDALIDALASLTLEPIGTQVTGEAAIAAIPTTRRVGSKPFALEGLNTDTEVWEQPAAGQRYSAFQTGVQLANRLGPINEIEFSEFVVKTQAFADSIGASADFPEMRDEVSRARELDVFATQYDAQLDIYVRARDVAWSPGYIQQTAVRWGLIAGHSAGRMVLPSATDGLPAVLTLTFDAHAALADDPEQSAVRLVKLHLDMPTVSRDERPFERMWQLATGLAQDMDGQMSDENGNGISVLARDAILKELQDLYNVLDERDLAAGSGLARRLFS